MGGFLSKRRAPVVTQSQLNQDKQIVEEDINQLQVDRNVINRTEEAYHTDISNYNLYDSYFDIDKELYESSNLVSLKTYLTNIINEMNNFTNSFDNITGVPALLKDYNKYISDTYNYIYLYAYCNDKNTSIGNYINGNDGLIKSLPIIQ